jgi:apolipoprotein N-acyltransferase
MAEELDPSVEQPEIHLGPPVPKTVSLAWLFHNVPWRFWVVSVSALVAVFVAGIEVAQISWVRELVWRNEPKIVSTKAPSISDGEKPKPG